MKDIISNRIKKAVYNIPQGYEARIEGNKVIVETKENEDERIWIINYLSNRMLNSNIIAEKENLKKAIAWLKNQGEQKPTEKVEPKFKAGDWILHCGTENTYQVVGIKDNKYQMKCNGNYTEEKIADVERCARKWDITKDAKEGDVLVSPLIGDDKGGVQIFMFKCLENRDYADNCVEFYSRLCLGVFYNNEEHYFMGTTKSPVYPATKEQRDLLFQKMKEAGYEWDADAKVLKKIEQKSATMSLDEAIEHCREKSCGNNACALEHKQLEKWLIELKELKERKPAEWSKEDEYGFENCLYAIKETFKEVDNPHRAGTVDWLKSIKDRYTWKPSEEQMETLKFACGGNYVDLGVLESLYQDLKKLK